VPVLFGLIHGLVDLTTVSSIYLASYTLHGLDLLTPFLMILGYDILAFGLQAPFGAVADRFNLTKPFLLISLILVTLSPLGLPGEWATLLCAGLGNALFHLSAGAQVLAGSKGRAAPAGIFVAPGALGLGLGTWLARAGLPIWPLAFLTLAALALILFLLRQDRIPEPESDASPGFQNNRPQNSIILLYLIGFLLLASVSIRSFVGLGGCWQCEKTGLLMVMIPLTAFLGKLGGGLFADRFGWIETSTGALLLSAPLIALSGGSIWLALPGLLLFQATMPVTLTAVYNLIPARPATAFGLPCLALLCGAVITFFPAGKALFSSGLFLLLIPCSALCISVALFLSGISAGHRPGVTERGE
jgi:FSR family fosmidomycin resistance protein-like MFS transporter